MSRLFDPVSLLNEDLDANATKRDPLPVGEVLAQITAMKFSSGTIKNGDRRGEPWDRLDVTLEISDRDYLAGYGDGTQDKVTTTYGVMLEMTPDRKIATGANKNTKLGRFRDAAGVNGKPLAALQGQFIRIAVGHKPHPTDENAVMDEITSFTKV